MKVEALSIGFTRSTELCTACWLPALISMSITVIRDSGVESLPTRTKCDGCGAETGTKSPETRAETNPLEH